jgi:hypothetical protein
MENLRSGNRKIDLGSNDSTELFALGLTLLSAGNLKENDDLYDIHNMKFDKQEFLKRINFWLTRQRYSETLRILVAYLCHIRVYKRWSFSELWRWLSKYRAKIGAHEFFGNEVQLPEHFRRESEELKLNSGYISELPEGYPNKYYKEYEPKVVLADKSKEEDEAELEIQAINLKKSNASIRQKQRSQLSPNHSVLKKEKDAEELNHDK